VRDSEHNWGGREGGRREEERGGGKDNLHILFNGFVE
jgi:hypothetical protein